MTFREVRVYEIREIVRLWMRGEGLRSIERLTATDRKTVRRYVAAAVEFGVDPPWRRGTDDRRGVGGDLREGPPASAPGSGSGVGGAGGQS